MFDSKVDHYEQIEVFVYKLFQRGGLQKLLSSAKNVLAEHAHSCIVAIIHNIPVYRYDALSVLNFIG